MKMTSAALKSKKEDLRRLMKERRDNLKGNKEKIESPFAKYNSIGQLSCTVCNVQVKSNNLWTAHLLGKIHKENLQKRKKCNTEIPSKNSATIGVKRQENQPENVKKAKFDEEKSYTDSKLPKSTKQFTLLEGYSSSSEEDSDKEPEKDFSTTGLLNNTLPPDFFDSSSLSANTSSAIPNEKLPNNEEKSSSSAQCNNAETLPEGFFDDPVLDAKVRKIEYKDPKEEEWEKFQKEMAEETNVSKTIIEEDLEVSTLEREIVQIDEQIYQWERSKNLQSLSDEVKMKAPLKDENGDKSGSTDDELEEDDLLDWRSKGVKKV